MRGQKSPEAARAGRGRTVSCRTVAADDPVQGHAAVGRQVVPGVAGPGWGSSRDPSGEWGAVSDVERGTEGSGEKLLVVDDGQQAMDQVGQDAPDLVITDVMMPHVDGFELTRSLRQDPRTATISVIILTARGLSADKLEGFAIGADDYIVKPFDTPELLARVRGVLRRSKEMKDESPLTGLPGNVRIQEEIDGLVGRGEDFA